MIYLDNAATSFPKPESVYRAMDEFARTLLGNPGRSGHKMALASERVLEEARHLLNQLFHGEGVERFIFTLNGTDALNMAIKGVLTPGDHVVTTDLEHNSVSRPLMALERAGTITLTRVAADAGGTIDPEAVRAAVRPNTRLLAITHASNVLGTIQPVGALGQLARQHDLLLLVDAAQTAGAVQIDVQALHIDLLAFPGHKSLLGPTGTGALYVGPRARLRPWREGGTGGDSTSPTQPEQLPYFLEGGTPNVVGLAGLIAGMKYINERGLAAIHDHEVDLVRRLVERLDALPGFQVLGHRDWPRRVGVVSFRHAEMSAPDLGGMLDASFNVAIRPGLHCAPYIHRAQQTVPDGTVRVSPGPFNSPADIDALADALRELVVV
jgi:cysteine desulfurase family protein